MNSTQTNKRSWWPIAITIYFTIVIIAIAIFATWAVRQNMDLVRKDYYAQELQFQQQIDRANRTRQLQRTAQISFDDATHSIRIALRETSSETRGFVQLYRPSDASLDQHVKLSLNVDGVQKIDGAKLKSGLWKVRVTWKTSDVDFFAESSIVVPNNS
jgi:hypothetical protein